MSHLLRGELYRAQFPACVSYLVIWKNLVLGDLGAVEDWSDFLGDLNSGDLFVVLDQCETRRRFVTPGDCDLVVKIATVGTTGTVGWIATRLAMADKLFLHQW